MLHNILVFLQNNASCILFMLYFLFWVSMVYDYFGYIKFDDAPFAFLMLINTLTACIPAIILGIQANIPNIGSDVDSIPKLCFIALY